MNSPYPLHAAQILSLMFLVSVAVALAVKWIRIPYWIALSIVGALLGMSQVFPTVTLSPELVFLFFLPALLFEASWNLDLALLKRDWLPITILSTVGVGFSMFLIAAVLRVFGFIDLKLALVVGAILSTTDPVSVLAVFKEMGISKRLTVLIECESIFNDGTALVAFKIVLAAAMCSQPFAPIAAATNLVTTIAGGFVIGLLIGLVGAKAVDMVDDHRLEIMLTTVSAYGAFLIADSMQVSAILSVVVAGLILKLKAKLTTTSRFAIDSFWEYSAFALNSLMFLLIGMQVRTTALVENLGLIGIGIVALLVSRAVMVYLLCPLMKYGAEPIPYKWCHIIFWSGMRGSLTMAMVLSLPHNFPAHEQLISLTFGLVLFTLLVPGLTIERLARALKIERASDESAEDSPQGASEMPAPKIDRQELDFRPPVYCEKCLLPSQPVGQPSQQQETLEYVQP